MWYAGALNDASRGVLGDGFEILDTVPRRSRARKDRTKIWFSCTGDAQNRVLISSGEVNRRGYSLRVVTGHLAACIIDTTYEAAPADLQAVLEGRALDFENSQRVVTEV